MTDEVLRDPSEASHFLKLFPPLPCLAPLEIQFSQLSLRFFREKQFQGQMRKVGSQYFFWVDTRILAFKIIKPVAVRMLHGPCFSDPGKQSS